MNSRLTMQCVGFQDNKTNQHTAQHSTAQQRTDQAHNRMNGWPERRAQRLRARLLPTVRVLEALPLKEYCTLSAARVLLPIPWALGSLGSDLVYPMETCDVTPYHYALLQALLQAGLQLPRLREWVPGARDLSQPRRETSTVCVEHWLF